MAGISLNYNGVELSQWFDVTDVQRNIGTSHVNSMTKIGQSDGQIWQYMSRDAKTITINGIVTNANLANLRRDLGAALDVDEPEQLIIGDDTGVYYLAIYDGQPTIAEDWRSGTISLSFIVPDGIAHSVDTQTADNMPYKDVPVNLITGTSNQVVEAESWNMQVADIKYDKSLGEALCASVMINNAAHADILLRGNAFIVLVTFDSSGNKLAAASGNSVSYNANGLSWCSISIDDNTTDVKAYIFTNNMNVNAFYSCLKIEKGTSASPWSPNPADPEYYSDTITVKNDGTYPVYPVIEATMHSDNGVISFINEDNGGVLEFGNSEEVDGVTEQKSEQVIHYTFAGGKPDAGLTVNAGTMFYNDSGRSKISGGFVDPGSGDAVTPTFTGTSSDRWNGPTLYGTVPASDEGSNAGNFLYTNRINFPAAIGHTGRIELILGNDEGMQMVFVIREETLTRKQLVIEGWCMGKMLVNKTLDLNAFNSDFMEVQMGRIGANLLFQIAKISKLEGDVPVYASKLTFTPTYSDFAAVPISNMTTWFARFGATNASKLAWTDVKFEWTNISFWNDTANQYSAGDVLTVDVPNSTVALNGVLTGGLQRLGNDWSKFKLQPGSNKILVVTSSFAQTPDVMIYYKEAYV